MVLDFGEKGVMEDSDQTDWFGWVKGRRGRWRLGLGKERTSSPQPLPPLVQALAKTGSPTRRRAASNTALRCSAVAGGVVLAGLVVPAVIAPAPQSVGTLQGALWQATGAVRQSITELYRARRMLMQPQAGADASASPLVVPEAGPAAAATAPPPASSLAPASVTQPPTPPADVVAAVDLARTIDTNLEMRVAVAKGVSQLAVGLSGEGYLMNLDGNGYCPMRPQTSAIARPNANGIDFGGCQLSTAAWLESADGAYVYVGDRWYRGRVLLLSDGSTLMAVNFVLLLDYLSSVVGSEMYPDWPQEALKAQAVAARSYALTHHVRHANRAYDLDNTQRYQAYLGIAKETNTTQAAVLATAGEYISLQGGIVESLYAASDDIVQWAHGGRGMSQTGAMELAANGFSYEQILANYYPGTGLSVIEVGE